MSNLEIAKEVIKNNIEFAECGIFNTKNTIGDQMDNIYSEDGLTIDICSGWFYFEVFGLSQDEFKELESFYNSLLDKQ